jgi:hypothetical protein
MDITSLTKKYEFWIFWGGFLIGATLQYLKVALWVGLAMAVIVGGLVINESNKYKEKPINAQYEVLSRR